MFLAHRRLACKRAGVTRRGDARTCDGAACVWSWRRPTPHHNFVQDSSWAQHNSPPTHSAHLETLNIPTTKQWGYSRHGRNLMVSPCLEFQHPICWDRPGHEQGPGTVVHPPSLDETRSLWTASTCTWHEKVSMHYWIDNKNVSFTCPLSRPRRCPCWALVCPPQCQAWSAVGTSWQTQCPSPAQSPAGQISAYSCPELCRTWRLPLAWGHWQTLLAGCWSADTWSDCGDRCCSVWSPAPCSAAGSLSVLRWNYCKIMPELSCQGLQDPPGRK